MGSSQPDHALDSSPGGPLSATVVAYMLNRAATANLESPLRRGCAVYLARRGSLLMTGDLHDNLPNLQRIIKRAALDKGPDRHVIIHEVIHGNNLINGCDFSVRTLARVAQLKLQYPNQVHILQANHELSQLGGPGITKNGVSVGEAFDAGIDYLYGEQAGNVRAAVARFIRSLLLAVRCENGVFCSHSLPSVNKLDTFDISILDRVPTETDLKANGAAYEMVWGRNHTQDLADTLAAAWGAKVFLLGHQPADFGYEREGQTMMVLASNHEHGVALPIDLKKTWDIDGLIARLVPLASISLSENG